MGEPRASELATDAEVQEVLDQAKREAADRARKQGLVLPDSVEGVRQEDTGLHALIDLYDSEIVLLHEKVLPALTDQTGRTFLADDWVRIRDAFEREVRGRFAEIGLVAEVVGWYESGLVPAGTRINAVTRALRAQYPDADDEELEFLATKAAEEISTVAAMTSGHRRATLAVDLPGEVAAPVAGAVTSMTTTADVPVADWAALFVDDLEWYAIEEIPHLQ